jgi:formate/nitrite transporter FocA (FNT family)
MMWVVVHGLPDLGVTAIESATDFVDAPLDLTAVCLAVLAGLVITLMTRMQQGAHTETGKIVAAVAGAFVLAGLVLFHSILDSLIIFAGIHAGGPFGYGDWLAWFWYTTLLNMAGGLGVVTLLRLVRSKNLIERERQDAGADG